MNKDHRKFCAESRIEMGVFAFDSRRRLQSPFLFFLVHANYCIGALTSYILYSNNFYDNLVLEFLISKNPNVQYLGNFYTSDITFQDSFVLESMTFDLIPISQFNNKLEVEIGPKHRCDNAFVRNKKTKGQIL